MQFRDQVEQMIQCKVNGMCARDGLVTEAMKQKTQDLDGMLRVKDLDDRLLVQLLKFGKDSPRSERPK